MSGCTSPPASESRSESRAPVRNSEPRHSLERDEAAGGHTLRKHVGRTDAELRDRLQRERDISAASTWNDRESAEAAVGAALARQDNKIFPWLARQSGHPNLVLDYDGDPAPPFGRTLRRGDDSFQPCAHAVIVLKWDGPTVTTSLLPIRSAAHEQDQPQKESAPAFPAENFPALRSFLRGYFHQDMKDEYRIARGSSP